MKVGVCIKQVPMTDSKISVNNGVLDASVYDKTILNPYDECALEEAIQWKNKGVISEIIAFSFDNDSKSLQDHLRTALAKGADRAVVIDGNTQGNDSVAVAKVLAAFCKKEELQIVFCGSTSTDIASAQIPAMMGELLDYAQVSAITSLELTASDFTARADIGMNQQAVTKGSVPAIFSCDKSLNTPKNPKIKDKQAAKNKPLDVLPVADLGVEAHANTVEFVNWSLPMQRSECKFIPADNIEQAVSELLGLLKHEAKVL